MSARTEVVSRRIESLIAGFDGYISAYDNSVPFSSRQFDAHRRTIERRRALGSVQAAVRDPEFIELIYGTLKAWRLGTRGSRLASADEISASLETHIEDLKRLDGISLEDLDDVEGVVQALWGLIDSLVITHTKAKLVASTKLLHHLLPDLVPPMDREYTGRFFRWPDPYFQDRQRQIFEEAFHAFAAIARAAKPSRLVGAGWKTSISKVVDNAVISYLRLEGSAPVEVDPPTWLPDDAEDIDEISRLAPLLRTANAVNARIAALIQRPVTGGHLGEFIASRVFDVELEPTAVQAGFDGRFRTGPLAGATVNVKFYGYLEFLLDIGRFRPDFYLVLTGPPRGAVSSRGGVRPWAVDSVFLFDAEPLVASLEERGMQVGIATSVRKEIWEANRVYPDGSRLELTRDQTAQLDLLNSGAMT